MTDLLNKIRYLLGDTSTTGSELFTYTTTSVFTLTDSNIISVSDVSVNDVSSGVTHTYASATQKVTISSSMTNGDTVRVDYTYYPSYSDAELTAYMQSALVHLSVAGLYFEYDSDDDTIYPQLEDKEENLIALIASIIINPDNRTIRLPDITIGVPNDLPTITKIRQIISSYKRGSHGVFDILY